MSTEILMPALSPTMEEGTLSKWLVKEGDEVQLGQPLATVEAMKMENILRAEKQAVVVKILGKEGDSLAVDSVILELD